MLSEQSSLRRQDLRSRLSLMRAAAGMRVGLRSPEWHSWLAALKCRLKTVQVAQSRYWLVQGRPLRQAAVAALTTVAPRVVQVSGRM